MSDQPETRRETAQRNTPAVRGAAESVASVPPGASEQLAQTITGVAHDTFVSGMSTAFTVAGVVAVLAAVVAGFTKRGENAEAGAGAAHI